MGRVPPLHPLADGWVVYHAVDAVEDLTGHCEIAFGDEVLTKVDLGVRDRLGVATLSCPLDTACVQLDRAVHVSEFKVQPPTSIQQTLIKDLVTHLLREREAFVKRCQGFLVRADVQLGDSEGEEA